MVDTQCTDQGDKFLSALAGEAANSRHGFFDAGGRLQLQWTGAPQNEMMVLTQAPPKVDNKDGVVTLYVSDDYGETFARAEDIGHIVEEATFTYVRESLA